METEKLELECNNNKCDSKEMDVDFYCDVNDVYFLICPKCQAENHIHFTGFDAIKGDY